jgi:hypothetical protein
MEKAGKLGPSGLSGL